MYLLFKKIVDVIIALIMFLFISPLFILIVILIKTDSKGPVFFFQHRIGKKLKVIKMLKFRTMQDNARDLSENGKKPIEKYITKVGSLLRGPRLDEIPQLINIIKGDMSFIGPRASIHKGSEYRNFRRGVKKKEKYNVRPGVLGVERLISVWPEKKGEILNKLPNAKHLMNLNSDEVNSVNQFNLYYVNNVSLYTDLILLYYGILLFFKEIIGIFKK